MKIAVTGANGAVGHALLRLAASTSADPIELVAIVRSERAAQALAPQLGRGRRIACVSYDDPRQLREALGTASAVVHLVGVLVERGASTYERAHVGSTARVRDAAVAGGVAKIVLVSAIGASETSRNRYWLTKARAETLVRDSGLSHTVLRVPLLLGPGTEASAALRARLGRRSTVMIGGGRTRQQPLDVDDLACAVIRCADPGVARDRTLDLVGPVSVSEREIVERAARMAGRRVIIHSVPALVARLAIALRQRVARDGFSTDALEVITTDTVIDPVPAATAVGITLTGLDAMIRRSLAA